MSKTTLPDLPEFITPGVVAGREPARAPDAPLFTSAELFGGGNQIWIEHNGERYSLRITRQRKLILTK